MLKRLILLVLIPTILYFGSSFVLNKIHVNDLYIQSEDILPALFMPVTLLKEGTLYVDTYYDLLVKYYPQPDDKDQKAGLTPFYLKKIGGHYISAFTLIPGLMAVPIYAVPVLMGMPITMYNVALLGHLTAAFYISLSGLSLFYLARKLGLSEKNSYLLSYIYLFGTVNLALLGQSLWQHGFLELFVIIGLYFIFDFLDIQQNENQKPDAQPFIKPDTLSATKITKLFLAFTAFGLAILSRPTAALVLPFMGFLLIGYSDQKFKTILYRGLISFLGLVPPVLFFLWYNTTFYQDISNQGYSSQLFGSWLSPFPQGFLGVWLSPSKGILVYSPIFIFAIWGLYLAFRNLPKYFPYVLFGELVILHTLIMSVWKHWYGGWSFGYRMSSDVIPFLVLLIIPFIQSKYFKKFQKLFYLAVLMSIFVQVMGLIFFDGIWHAAYDAGYGNQAWLWSITDSELIFNIRRVMVKLGLLSQACPKCL